MSRARSLCVAALAAFCGISISSSARAANWPDDFDVEEATFGAEVLSDRVDVFEDQVLDELSSEIQLIKAAHRVSDSAEKLHDALLFSSSFEEVILPTYELLAQRVEELNDEWIASGGAASSALVSRYDAVIAWHGYVVDAFENVGGGSEDLICSITSHFSYLPQRPSGQFIGNQQGWGFASFDECQGAITDANHGMLCSWSGLSYLPYNIRFGHALGGSLQGHGFSDYPGCKQAIDDSDRGLVCSWSGVSYLPYVVRSGKRLGGSAQGHGFSDYPGCAQAVDDATTDLICSWSGVSYLPYSLETGDRIGGSAQGHGFSDYGSCQGAIAAQQQDLVCSWNGQSYLPYRVSDGGAIAAPGQVLGFGALDQCNAAIGIQQNKLVCSWTGFAYLPHRIADGYRLGNKDGFGMSSVDECVSAVQGSRPHYVCSWSGQSYFIYRIENGLAVGPAHGTLSACFATLATIGN